MLVVVAGVAPSDERLLMRAFENFFVRRGEFKIYHRNFLVELLLVVVGALKLRLRLPALTPCGWRDPTSRPGYRGETRARRASGRPRPQSTSPARQYRCMR